MQPDPTLACDFTLRHYTDALTYAQAVGYSFVSFPEVAVDSAAARLILLRHDVDHSPSQAVTMAETEHSLGVRATYFILPSGEYNVLGRAHAAVRRIIELGHWVGLHYDPSHYLEAGLPFPETVHREAAILQDRFGVEIRVAARHNPASGQIADHSITPLLDAYQTPVSVKYLSDSCGYWREGCFCGALAGGAYDALQVLIHPEWWSDAGTGADGILDRIRDERVADVNEVHRQTRRLFASLEHLPHRDLFRDS